MTTDVDHVSLFQMDLLLCAITITHLVALSVIMVRDGACLVFMPGMHQLRNWKMKGTVIRAHPLMIWILNGLTAGYCISYVRNNHEKWILYFRSLVKITISIFIY